MASNESNIRHKRRRTSPQGLHISDLPESIIKEASSYLPDPSRALLAVAFGSHEPSAMSRAILSSSFDVLDFGDVEKSLSSKLTDSDIRAVLLACADTGNELRSLKLGGCVNITGCGLEPLRSSTNLELIDLSLSCEHESPLIKPEPAISEEAVLPILTSIVEADGNSLVHLQLPKKLKSNGPVCSFISRYNSSLNHRGLMCSECDSQIDRPGNGWNQWMGRGSVNFGVQQSTCYQCSRHFCADYECRPRLCTKCERHYCEDCLGLGTIETTECDAGDEDSEWKHMVCSACEDLSECEGCRRRMCSDCMGACVSCNKRICHRGCACWTCEKGDCKNFICIGCYDNEAHHLFDECPDESCDHRIECPDCRLASCESDLGDACVGCIKMIAPLIFRKNQALQKENKELCQENLELRQEKE